MPRREPSAAAPTSTTIGWNVKGTGVNGSGIAICAASAVSAVTATTAPVCSTARTRASARLVSASTNVGYIGAHVTRMPTALTIAGSDSSAGAGVQADLKTFAAFDVYGVCAITAITAQSTNGVEAVAPLPADLVTAQIEAVAGDFAIAATKIGMLATAAIVEAVAAAIEELELPLVVVDPVLVSTSGQRLLDADG